MPDSAFSLGGVSPIGRDHSHSRRGGQSRQPSDGRKPPEHAAPLESALDDRYAAPTDPEPEPAEELRRQLEISASRFGNPAPEDAPHEPEPDRATTGSSEHAPPSAPRGAERYQANEASSPAPPTHQIDRRA